LDGFKNATVVQKFDFSHAQKDRSVFSCQLHANKILLAVYIDDIVSQGDNTQEAYLKQ